MFKLLAATVLLLVACGDNIDTIDRAEACAEQAAAWCAAVDATEGASTGPGCPGWYESRCGGPEPMQIEEHDACMSALERFELEPTGPLVPPDCQSLWPAIT